MVINIVILTRSAPVSLILILYSRPRFTVCVASARPCVGCAVEQCPPRLCADSNYSYPPCTVADEETKTEMINRELQVSQREKQEILAFESHLAAASTKQTITESNSLLLSQLTSLDPQ